VLQECFVAWHWCSQQTGVASADGMVLLTWQDAVTHKRPADEREWPRQGNCGPAEGSYPGPMAYASLGMLNAVCLLGVVFLDGWRTGALGTLPLFLFVGLVGGGVVGRTGHEAELRRVQPLGLLR